MAALELQKGWYRIVFRYAGQKFQRALDTQNRKEAMDLKARVEGNLKLLQLGRLAYDPAKDDLITLLLTDGKLNARPEPPARRVKFGEFLDEYEKNRPPDKENNTAYTEKIHIKHLRRLIGDDMILADVPGKLQQYVAARSREESRLGGTVSHVTIKKELGTLTSIWNGWGYDRVPSPLSLKKLKYPKKTESLPFMTWDQIERRIAKGKIPTSEQDKLWDALYLSVPQVEELLTFVRTSPSLIRGHKHHFAFVYPMFCFAAYTGARRSEILRSRLVDLDFEAGEVAIREKKKDRSKKETLRHVPMAEPLRRALEGWLEQHPGGPHTFCKKESEPLTEQMATHHLRWALEGGKWKVVKGWHVFRHSLISGMAARGVPDRIIMEVVGHLNRETTRRYQHIQPSTVRDSMGLLFGDRAFPVAKTEQSPGNSEPATTVG